jgi:hypothetical protein
MAAYAKNSRSDPYVTASNSQEAMQESKTSFLGCMHSVHQRDLGYKLQACG